jgi:methylated-DNA-[protein]-cysteine S-methyltransferase
VIIETTEIETPIGPLVLAIRDARVCVVAFDRDHTRVSRALRRRFGEVSLRSAVDPAGIAGRMRAYFGGELHALESIAVDTGGTAFQVRVWSALRRIPVGGTVSYGELSATIGAPRAVRAVGLANGANPVAIVVPCHRVIGADGSLTGYGGGIERKRWLLAHEGAIEVEPTLAFATGQRERTP